MCSVFRRRIASLIISSLKPFLAGTDKGILYDKLPLYIKFNQQKCSPPSFEISWKDISRVKPDLRDLIHPTSLITYLKNQDFPTNDGIVDICQDLEKKDKIIFSTDQELFTSSVLLDINSRIASLPLKSTFFKSVTPEIIIVEYSSPNIAKPFHYGHFRSTVIGNFLANIFQYVGHEVTRINYVGDWGLQYGILAAGFNELGSTEKLLQDPLGHLYEVYTKANIMYAENSKFNKAANDTFVSMEKGDEEVLKQWRNLREISLKKMEETYLRLRVKFDATHSESMYFNKVKRILNNLIENNVACHKEDGSIQIDNLSGINESIVLQKSDGTSLYLSRDLAAAIDRQNQYHFDSMFYVVDTAQQKHFSFLKCILKSLKHSWESNVHHIPFGRVLNFSTRKGTAVFLHDILDEAQERTLERMHQSPNTKVTENLEEVADVLGISSLIINDFKCRRKKDVQFSWDKVLSMTEDSGVALQYCHARLCSIEENCGFELNSNCDLNSLTESEAISLVAHLAKFDEIIYSTYTSLEPCILVHYLFALRNEVGRAIKVLPVKGSNPYVAKARLLLFHSAKLVLNKSFELLGLIPLKKM